MENLDLLVQAVHHSPKYRNVCLDVVSNIGARELAARRNLKDAVKATKNKLHQIGAAYFDAANPWSASVPGDVGAAREPPPRTQRAWLAALRTAVAAGNQAEMRRLCAAVMQHHSSTRERLPVLDQFYAQTLAGLPPPRVVLDIACGFNPLAIPWMALAPGVQYLAYDMYTDLAGFLTEFLAIVGVRGRAEACDVIQSPPARRADLALILKTLPCAEQQDKLAGARLLENINADHLLVSFPVRTLGGRDKAMLENYERHFRDLVAGKPWSVQRFEFATELAFLVHK